MADQPYSRPIHRELVRCYTCSAWWSVSELEVSESSAGGLITPRCPCGGIFGYADLEKHRASLPYHPHVRQPPKKEP